MKKYLMNLRMLKKLLLSPLVVIIFFSIFAVVAYIGFTGAEDCNQRHLPEQTPDIPGNLIGH